MAGTIQYSAILHDSSNSPHSPDVLTSHHTASCNITAASRPYQPTFAPYSVVRPTHLTVGAGRVRRRHGAGRGGRLCHRAHHEPREPLRRLPRTGSASVDRTDRRRARGGRFTTGGCWSEHGRRRGRREGGPGVSSTDRAALGPAVAEVLQRAAKADRGAGRGSQAGRHSGTGEGRVGPNPGLDLGLGWR